MSRQACTVSRWSQASNLSGSRRPGQVPPGADEGVLDRVSRELAVPEDQAGGRVQPRDGRVGERREGVMIASLCSLDETSLVHGRLGFRHGTSAALGCYGAGSAGIVPGRAMRMSCDCRVHGAESSRTSTPPDPL